MRILVIGGSGNISWHCVKLFEKKHDVWVLNRRATLKTRRSLDDFSINLVQVDRNNTNEMKRLLDNNSFDVVIDFICYKAEQAYQDIELFEGKTKQLIFISSAANYDRRHIVSPIQETNELWRNSDWDYVNGKIECEDIFLNRFQETGFPVTIIRPGHTYDTLIPDVVGNGDWTNAARLINDKPIIIHGDGTNIWTLTHSADVASAVEALLLNEKSYGECYHITSNEHMNWIDIMTIISNAVGNNHPQFVYVPSKKILEEDFYLGIGIIGHKMWNDIYDNTKIKEVTGGWEAKIENERGINESVRWLQHDDCRKRVNNRLDIVLDELCKKYI